MDLFRMILIVALGAIVLTLLNFFHIPGGMPAVAIVAVVYEIILEKK